jgi:hypothetical protein
MDLVPVAEQISNAQLTDLADAESRGICGHEQGAVFAIEARAPKESLQLLHAVDPGAQDRFFHSRQGLFNRFRWAMEHYPEKKAQRTDGHDEGTDGQLLDPQQMQEVGLDLVVPDLIGGTVIELG